MEGLNGIALEFAAYIVKTIRTNTKKGKWHRDHADFGKDTFPFEWNGQTIFPYGCCQKRIFDGEGDDLVFKYQVLILPYVGGESSDRDL